MKKSKCREIFVYIYLVILYLWKFIGRHCIDEDLDIDKFVVIFAALFGFALVLFADKISKVHLALISVVSLVAIIFHFEYLFCFFPVIVLLIYEKFVSDKEKTYCLIFTGIHIISEYVVFFISKKGIAFFHKYEVTDYLFFAFLFIFAAVFFFIIVFMWKKTDAKNCFAKKRQIKAKKRISENDKKTISEYYSIIRESLICFASLIYALNIVLFSAIKFIDDSICTLIVVMWSFFAFLFIRKRMATFRQNT